jgi:hypothetical protein
MPASQSQELFVLSHHADKVVFWSTVAMCATYLLAMVAMPLLTWL